MNKIIVKLTKFKELEDATHVNNRPEGEVTYGILDSEPKVGEVFRLSGINSRPGMRGFRTSTVQELIDGQSFKTHNSIYNWQIIEEDQLPGDEINHRNS